MKILWFAIAFAAVASSTNYQIESDSLNFGGLLSTSPNYRLEDTLGEIATGNSSGTTYKIKAGYRAMLGSSISISAPSNLTLSSIVSAPSGRSEGSVAWTVITDNEAGYTLAIKAATTPALKSNDGSDSFANYSPGSSVPDYTWSVAANASEFGFSPEGTDVASSYLDNGSTCGTGSSETANRCWDGFLTNNKTIASRASNNTPNGTVTTVQLRADITADRSQTVGNYSATLTATALAQ
ncbi:MAG: hypothetical protein HY481_02340 [Candidatus Vogelbacteria bacterium]|nr:hypothetical protein [Candidatus Vogelbacteria bacterium]